MARTKQVFPRDEVAHLWAHKAQDSARDSSGSFFFTGSVIYSYGAHFAIAKILGDECGPALSGRVLWNTDTHSNTTAKHKSIVWRALTRQQRETHLNVPGMNDNSARAIDRALREKRLPDESIGLLRYIRENVAALAGKKHGSGPFCDALRKAREFQETAVLFYARSGRKYPLPMIPMDNAGIPAEKVARDAFILTFARADLERQYRENLKHAQDGLKVAIDARDNPDAGATWYMHERNAEGARDRARNAIASAMQAANLYVRIHGADKKSRAAQAAIKALAPIVTALEARVTLAKSEAKRERIERSIKRYSHARGMVRTGSTAYHHVNGLRESVYHAAGIASEALAVGIPAESWMHGVAEKMARAYEIDSLQREVVRVGQFVDHGDSYWQAMENGSLFVLGDAKREYDRAVKKFAYLETQAASHGMGGRVFTHFAGAMRERVAVVRERLAGIDARIAAENAERIASWIAGASDVRPAYEAGTFARINPSRATVETTRGASVPIEHACRLARMYAVTVRRGGQDWADGAGPMVGHYRVNKIGADGSLVIGCHEFDPTEAKRLHDVLSACKECVAVVA